MKIPEPNDIYKHFKGNLYKIITMAEHSETGERMVVYQALYGSFQVYVRPLESFAGKLDREKYPEAEQACRFEPVGGVIGRPLQETPREARSGQTEEAAESGKSVPEPGKAAGPDPLVLEFLDADTHEDRLNILAALKSRITDDMINTMAVAVDVRIEEGDITKRYEALKNCLLTLEKYECSRLS